MFEDAAQNPFRGLRPFESRERHLFFGRADELEALEEKLEAHRFLGVVGTSGSGKSSLVRAGLIPELLELENWRVALMRPGDKPIESLAAALNSRKAELPNQVTFWGDGEGPPNDGSFTLATLGHGTLGLIDTIAEFRVSEKVLIVVDQFEEIFRFEDQRGGQSKSEAADFVRLIIEASQQRDIPIYVCLTMRSDFLGECPVFAGLPEALNDSQYLVPRLSRANLRQTIEEPVRIAGEQISPRLVTHLLNEVVDTQDQLPLLQHALMRTFDNFAKDRSNPDMLDLQHFPGMKTSLSDHADTLFQSLTADQQAIAESMFRSLTMLGASGMAVRRPGTVREVLAVSRGRQEDLLQVIERFRAPGNSFLMPPPEEAITLDTVLDISHESLIRVWSRVDGWIEDEIGWARTYQRLVEDARAWEQGKRSHLVQPELGLLLKWRNDADPHEGWASRYDPPDVDHSFLDLALEYLEKSRIRYKRWRITKAVTPVAVVIVIAAAGLLYLNSQADAESKFQASQIRQAKAEKEAAEARAAASQAEAERIAEERLGEFMKEFASALSGTSQQQQQELLRLIGRFAEAEPANPGDRYLSYLDTLAMIRRTDKFLASGDKPLVSAVHRSLTRRHELHAANPGYAGSDFAGYLKDTIETVERLMPKEPVRQVEGGSAVFAGANRLITALGRDILFFDGAEKDHTIEDAHESRVLQLEVSASLDRIVTVEAAGIIKLWDISQGKLPAAPLHQLDLSDAKRQILSASGEEVRAGRFETLTSVALFSPRNNMKPASSADSSMGMADPVSPAPDAAEPWILAGTRGGEVVVWDSNQDPVAILRDDSSKMPVRAVAATMGDGGTALVMTGSEDGAARVYELGAQPAGVVQPQPPRPRHQQYIWDVAIDGHGRLVTSSYDKVVKVWDDGGNEVATLASPATPEVHRDYVFDVELSSDGRYVASAGRDRIVNVWSTERLDEPEVTFLGAPAAGDRGARRVRFHPRFGQAEGAGDAMEEEAKLNRQVLVSTNAQGGVPARTLVWHLDEVARFDETMLDAAVPDLEDRLEAGLISGASLEQELPTVSDLIGAANRFISDRRYTRVRNKAYNARIDRNIKEVLQLILDRADTADWDERMEIMVFLPGIASALKTHGLEDRMPKMSEEILGFEGIIRNLPTDLRGRALQLVTQAAGEPEEVKERIARALWVLTKSARLRDRGKKRQLSLKARQLHENPLTNAVVEELADAPDVALTAAEVSNYGFLDVDHWLEQGTTAALLEGAGYFSRHASNTRHFKLIESAFNRQHDQIFDELTAVEERARTASYCTYMRRFPERASVKDILSSRECVAAKALGKLTVDDEVDNATLTFVKDALASETAELPAIFASIAAAQVASRKFSTSAYSRPDSSSMQADAVRWAKSAYRLSRNPATEHVRQMVKTREKPPLQEAFFADTEIKAVRFGHDATSILIGGVDAGLQQFRFSGAGPRQAVVPGASAAFHAILGLDGARYLTAGPDRKLVLWDLARPETAKVVQTLELPAGAGGSTVSGTMTAGFVVAGSPTIAIASDLDSVSELKNYDAAVMLSNGTMVASTPSRLFLLGADASVMTEKPWLRRESRGGRLLFAGGGFVLAGDLTGLLTIFDESLARVGETKLDGGIRAIAFSEARKTFFVGTTIGLVYEIDAAGERQLEFKAGEGAVAAIDVHPRSPDLILTGGRDRTAKLWSLSQVREFLDREDAVYQETLTLDELVRERVLVSNHLGGVLRTSASDSADRAARYLVDRRKDYPGDDVFDRVMRENLEDAFRLLREQYPVDSEIADEFSVLAGPENSQPKRCFDEIMDGGVEWGGGTRWNPTNATNLCARTPDARGTIDCFSAEIAKGIRWQGAIETCKAR